MWTEQHCSAAMKQHHDPQDAAAVCCCCLPDSPLAEAPSPETRWFRHTCVAGCPATPWWWPSTQSYHPACFAWTWPITSGANYHTLSPLLLLPARNESVSLCCFCGGDMTHYDALSPHPVYSYRHLVGQCLVKYPVDPRASRRLVDTHHNAPCTERTSFPSLPYTRPGNASSNLAGPAPQRLVQ